MPLVFLYHRLETWLSFLLEYTLIFFSLFALLYEMLWVDNFFLEHHLYLVDFVYELSTFFIADVHIHFVVHITSRMNNNFECRWIRCFHSIMTLGRLLAIFSGLINLMLLSQVFENNINDVRLWAKFANRGSEGLILSLKWIEMFDTTTFSDHFHFNHLQLFYPLINLFHAWAENSLVFRVFLSPLYTVFGHVSVLFLSFTISILLV